jgi:uncharacterized membrane protein HdeD (DUF308 family)
MKLTNIWWLLLLRGIIFIIFGLIAISWPAMTLVVLDFIFAFLILFSGISNLISGITSIGHEHKYWFLTIIAGIFEIGVSAYAFNNPGIGIAALILLIGFTFIIRGVFEIFSAFDDIYSTSQRTLLAIGGALGVIAGIVVLRYPVTGGLAFIWVLGLYTIVVGSIYIALSIMTKGAIDDITKHT